MVHFRGPDIFSLLILKETPKSTAIMRILFKNVLVFGIQNFAQKMIKFTNYVDSKHGPFLRSGEKKVTHFKRDPKKYSNNADFLQKCVHFWNPKCCSKNDQIYEAH